MIGFSRYLMIFLFSIFMLLAVNTHAFAQDENEQLVKIRVLPGKGQISAGEEIWIGIEQSITPQWHTYWQNPGDSGTAPRHDWTLPKGFEIGTIQWPTPKKIPYGPLLNYGYEDRVILLQKLKAPETLPASPLTLSVDVELLVCKEECIPEYGTYEITLNGADAGLEDNTAYIEAAKKKLPQKANWKASFSEDEKDLILTFSNAPAETFSQAVLESAEFMPIDWGIVSNPAQAELMLEKGEITLKQKKGDRNLDEIKNINGLLVFETEDAQRQSYHFTAQPHTSSIMTQSTVEGEIETSFIQAIILAILGGLILNLMPCVFPVLSIKALSLVKNADKEPKHVRMSGLAYTAGVILSFLAIAGLLVAFKTAGAQIGWGFQLQNPMVVGILAYLLFIIGLNLAGMFEFANPFANTGQKLTQTEGHKGSFFTGVLATLVATPCTAPFMATALGYALTQPALQSMLVFAALGLGLALPYLLLCYVPALRSKMPKPGAWMETFKQFLAFPMFGATVWLIWVLSEQAGPSGVLAVLTGITLIAFALWLLTKRSEKSASNRGLIALSILCFIIAIFALPNRSIPQTQTDTATAENTFGEVFTQEKLDTLLAETSNPIFVEMTAAWCITCKVNHATSINIDSTKQVFAENNVTYLIGDWTNQNPEITKFLDRYGRKGVPIYVFYGAKDENGKRPEGEVLAQMLTPQIVKDAILK